MSETFDVCVAGGGSAGMAAAVAAARVGAQTVLVERHGSLGGMASAAFVHSVCGLYRLPAKDAPAEMANGGLAAEFGRRLLATGALGPVRLGRVDVLLHRPSCFARLADQWVREALPNLTVLLHTEIADAQVETVALVCRGSRRHVQAKSWVDTTGDAVLATLRGAPCEMEASGRLQRPAFIFALGGVAPAVLADDGRLRLAHKLVTAVRAGTLPSGVLGAHFRASPQPGEAFVTIDLSGGDDFNPLDAACLTRLEEEGRALGERLIDFLRVEAEGFSTAYIAAWPSRAGVRESRRVVGKYRLETDDVAAGAEFPDMVARSAWPMELRETASGPRLRFPADDRSCEIPLRALQARDDDALFMAGRCLSCSHEAQASIRVIGTCLATGEAAGLAAALTALHGECDAESVRAARARIAR